MRVRIKTKTKTKAKDKDIDNNDDKDMENNEHNNKTTGSPLEEQVGLQALEWIKIEAETNANDKGIGKQRQRHGERRIQRQIIGQPQ